MNDSLFSLEGRTIAVLGAGAGIGRAVAAGCARAGARVHCLDLDPEAARASSEALGSNGSFAGLDVRDPVAVDAALTTCAKPGGRLDGVVLTPGVNVRKPLLEYTEDEFDRVIGLNLKAALWVLQSAGRQMRAQGSGSIVLFSSIRSLVVEPGQGIYAATKAGIVQMVRTAAAELGPAGVRVNAVAPGVVETPLTQPIRDQPDWYRAYQRKSVFDRWAKPEEMAGPTVFLLSQAASYVTGTVLFADGGWTAADGRFTPPGMGIPGQEDR